MKVDWISVKDRLPDTTRKVWLLGQNGAVMVSEPVVMNAQLELSSHWAEIEYPDPPPRKVIGYKVAFERTGSPIKTYDALKTPMGDAIDAALYQFYLETVNDRDELIIKVSPIYED